MDRSPSRVVLPATLLSAVVVLTSTPAAAQGRWFVGGPARAAAPSRGAAKARRRGTGKKASPGPSKAAGAAPGSGNGPPTAPTEGASREGDADAGSVPSAGEPSPAAAPQGAPAKDARTAAPEPAAEGSSRAPETQPDPDAARALLDEAEALRDEIFEARARLAAATRHLAGVHLVVGLRTNLPRFYRVEDFVISLDGAPVYVRKEGLDTAGDDLVDLRAAPGVHRLGVRMNLVARRNPEHRQHVVHEATVDLPEGRDAFARLVLREVGNLWRLGKRRRGTSRWIVFFRVRTRKPRRHRRGGAAVRARTAGNASGARAAKGGK